MKSRRLQEGEGRCRSKQHKAAFQSAKKAFPNYRIYNEYPYTKITEVTDFGSLRADMYIKDLEIAIEINGEQHYAPVTFGGSPEEAKVAFKRQLVRDYNKRYLAREHDFYLVELPHYTRTPNEIEWLNIIADVRIKGGNLYRIEEDGSKYLTIPIDLEGNEIEDGNK